MNLDEEADSPWSDQRSISSQTASNTAQNDDDPVESTEVSPPTPAAKPAAVKSPGGGRQPRNPRRFVAQPTRLEAVDSDLDPLGPLGATAEPTVDLDLPPELPQKEPSSGRGFPQAASTAPARSTSSDGNANDGLDERRQSRGRVVPQFPQQPSGPETPKKQTASSVSIEQAARPTFQITVGDPHKVGDLTSSHTVYQVRTKTTSKAFRQPEFEVSRRYRDFLWLYNQLHSNNPGVVVPPPPEKQLTGRFESDFVEQRRSALERMLNKAASHLILQHDSDLKLFLESDSFNVDIKNRERKDSDVAENKGMFSSLNLGVGGGAKFIEHDDWFLDRRVYLDTLETQLKGLLKATETSIAQRRALSEASSEFSASLSNLSQVELAPSLTGPLASLADLQLRIRDLYSRQAQQDVLTLSTVIEEYIRIVGSIKKAFEQRQRSWQLWHNAESDLQKRRSALDKLHRQGRSQQDRMTQLQADVSDAERRSHQARLTFEDLGKGMRAELERFENEKVEDFRMGVETYLESSVEAQKELIELWETYLMQLDADDEEPDPYADASSVPYGRSNDQPHASVPSQPATPAKQQTLENSEASQSSVNDDHDAVPSSSSPDASHTAAPTVGQEV